MMRLRFPEHRLARLGLALLAGVFVQPARDAAAAAAPQAQVFAPGTISATGNVDAITFAPDGATAWFDAVAGGGSTIMESHRVAGGWTTPRVASFSGEWRDLDPAMAPDGSFLVFCSNRPVAAGGKALDATTFDGHVRVGYGSHLWRVDRLANGWGEPTPLPPQVNDDNRVYSPSVVRDGSVYYQHPDATSRTYHLMRAKFAGGRYLPPEAVTIGPRDADERDPAVAPDESFIVFSTKQPSRQAESRLVISLRTEGHWGAPIDLGDGVNHDGAEGPHLGPDGRTIFFDSTATFVAPFPRTRAQTEQDLERARLWDNGNSHLWSVSLSPWLDGR